MADSLRGPDWRNRPKQRSSLEERLKRRQTTDETSKEMIERERERQAEKTARLRALRLGQK